MARGSSRRAAARRNEDDDGNNDGEGLPINPRERNRAVAEREASRLARPERRKVGTLPHANRKKSAVTSTPSGYFARKTGNDDDDADEMEPEEWCGPFSVARQMIAKREEARRKREAEQENNEAAHPLDEMMEEVDMERKRKAFPSLQWKARNLPSDAPSNQSYYAKRQKRVESQSKTTIPSLFQLCVNFLVENFEYVEALGDVDSSIRRAICEELVAAKKMNAQAFDAIAETGIEALELIDCAEVTQDQLAKSLEKLIPAGLRFLLLHHSGRCFGPRAVRAIITAPVKSLFAISISGAYILKDEDVAALVAATAPSLSSIEFKACPLIGTGFCTSLSSTFSAEGKGHLLELSLEELCIKKDDLLSLAKSSDALRNLKSITLKQIESVDDEVVLAILDSVGDSLEGIDLGYNHKLTDECLSGIRRCNKSGALRSLQLCGLKDLTEAGLEALFTPDIAGLPHPPMLRKLNLSGCDFDAVTDEVLSLATKSSSMKRDNDTITDSLSSMGGLVHVNIHGSACTDRTMENLVATAKSSLRELDVSFCPHISDKGLGYLVSKVGPQLAKVHIWGCAQITDEFLDGHDRVGDGSFEVVGAWMKKSGGLSVR